MAMVIRVNHDHAATLCHTDIRMSPLALFNQSKILCNHQKMFNIILAPILTSLTILTILTSLTILTNLTSLTISTALPRYEDDMVIVGNYNGYVKCAEAFLRLGLSHQVI